MTTSAAPVLALWGLTWLTPMTGVLLAAILVPLLVLLYFLKLRRKHVAIPTTLLWKRSIEDLHANAPFQRLRLNPLLLLQLLLLTFVALALAQPRMDLGQTTGDRAVLLIDRSASMSATDLKPGSGNADGEPGTTRLEIAVQQAAQWIEKRFTGGLFSAAPGEVMIVAFADGAEVVQPFTRSKAELLRALERIQPTDGGSRLAEALALARAYTTMQGADETALAMEPVHFALFSDGRISDLETQVLRPGEQLSYHVIGRADATNAGIEGIAAERSSTEPGLMQIFVTLRNDGPDPIESDLQLAVDGTVRTITPKPITVKGGGVDPATGTWQPGIERWTFPPIVQPREGAMTVELLRRDALAVDNLADIVVGAPRRLHVALVGAVNTYTAQVVGELPLERLESLTPEEFVERCKAGGAPFDVVIANAGALPEPLPPGRYLIYGVPAGLSGLNPFGTKEHMEALSMRTEHPVLRMVNLTDLRVARTTAFAPGSDVEVLVEGSETPLVAMVRRGATQALVTGFDPLDSNFPFLRAFVAFTANAVEWLGALDQAASQEEHRTGQALVTRVPLTARQLQMKPPHGPAQPVTARDGLVTYGPVERAGIYVLTWTDAQGEGRRAFAVNPAPGEGHIAAAPEIALGSQTLAGRQDGGLMLSDLWPYALLAALLLLPLEWWMYQRRHWIKRMPASPRGAPIIRA